MVEIRGNAKPLANFSVEPEIRAAELYTEFTIGGRDFNFKSKVGARSCSAQAVGFEEARGTLTYELACDLTFFATEHPDLGPVRIFQDPRIENRGWIYARRNQDGTFEAPALSYFNQYLIFHLGEDYFYYPRAWQVVSSITQWPPEYHQYHHLETRTPVFDLITREPNVAVKGVSTISILGELDQEQIREIRAAHDEEIAKFKELPASKLAPENLTPAQVGPLPSNAR